MTAPSLKDTTTVSLDIAEDMASTSKTGPMETTKFHSWLKITLWVSEKCFSADKFKDLSVHALIALEHQAMTMKELEGDESAKRARLWRRDKQRKLDGKIVADFELTPNEVIDAEVVCSKLALAVQSGDVAAAQSRISVDYEDVSMGCQAAVSSSIMAAEVEAGTLFLPVKLETLPIGDVLAFVDFNALVSAEVLDAESQQMNSIGAASTDYEADIIAAEVDAANLVLASQAGNIAESREMTFINAASFGCWHHCRVSGNDFFAAASIGYEAEIIAAEVDAANLVLASQAGNIAESREMSFAAASTDYEADIIAAEVDAANLVSASWAGNIAESREMTFIAAASTMSSEADIIAAEAGNIAECRELNFIGAASMSCEADIIAAEVDAANLILASQAGTIAESREMTFIAAASMSCEADIIAAEVDAANLVLASQAGNIAECRELNFIGAASMSCEADIIAAEVDAANLVLASWAGNIAESREISFAAASINCEADIIAAEVDAANLVLASQAGNAEIIAAEVDSAKLALASKAGNIAETQDMTCTSAASIDFAASRLLSCSSLYAKLLSTLSLNAQRSRDIIEAEVNSANLVLAVQAGNMAEAQYVSKRS
ncbi:hypothetical protein BC829DRAFT_443698 [Chytridium lagenaria]|nr:hypothetical protein BC829DRAFT_443698 [Chytridium lagenaria]